MRSEFRFQISDLITSLRACGVKQSIVALFLLLSLSACTDYLDEFKDEYDEAFIALEESSSSEENVFSSSQETASSSSVKLSSSTSVSSSSIQDSKSSSSTLVSSSSTQGAKSSSSISVSSSSIQDSKSSSSTSVSSSSNNKEDSSSSVESSSSVGDDRIHPNRVGPVSQYGKLMAGVDKQGNGRIYGSCEGVKDGAEVQVRGMSLFWSVAPEAMKFWSKDGIEAMVRDMNIQIVRAPMAVSTPFSKTFEWNGIQLEDYLHNSTQQNSFVKTVVEAAIKNDIYVIIDWHSDVYKSYTNEALEFFENVAKEYGQYDNVIFEVWSEPGSVDISTVLEHANSVIAAIRKYSDNLVLVESQDWSEHPDVCAQATIYDSKKNYACTLHFWAGTFRVDDSGFGSRAERAMTSGVPVFVSEWGTAEANNDGAVDHTSSYSWLAFMDKHAISWTNWSASTYNQSSSAFLEDTTKTSLRYTTSGNLVKDYLAENNPPSYTKCSAK